MSFFLNRGTGQSTMSIYFACTQAILSDEAPQKRNPAAPKHLSMLASGFLKGILEYCSEVLMLFFTSDFPCFLGVDICTKNVAVSSTFNEMKVYCVYKYLFGSSILGVA
ncbi:hypothetical protein Plhal304r1_c065g0153211 [Plasmopara halstedii]